MAVKIERQDCHWLVRLDGEVTLVCARQLQEALLEWLREGKDLELEMEEVEEIDVAALQVLWAAGREAAEKKRRITARYSAAVRRATADAGFEPMPALRVEN
jgi:anti-anti-sigma factor